MPFEAAAEYLKLTMMIFVLVKDSELREERMELDS
jgi:hypothetical protein